MNDRRLPVAVLCALMLGTLAGPARGHPLGNDTITHFSVLYIYPDRMEIDLLLDIAENQAFVFRQTEIDADGNGEDTIDEQKAWLEQKVAEYLPYVTVRLDGRPLTTEAVGGLATAPAAAAGSDSPKRVVMKIPGVGGLPTYRLLIRYTAALPPLEPGRRYTLEYSEATYPQTPGLKRVIIERPTDIRVHEKDRAYWDEGPDPFIYELYDPSNVPQERTARIVFSLGRESPPAESLSAAGRQPLAPWTSFTDPRNDPAAFDKYRRQAGRVSDLLATGVSVPTLAIIAALCFAYGAMHALAPGHAKTIVAAYLISLRGTYWHAILLAIIVTLTHTALVVIVGLVFLEASPRAGSRLQLWLGVTAGIIIACMGGWLMFRAVTGRLRHHDHERSADHHHKHLHSDEPHPPGHTHPHRHTHAHSPGHGHDHPHEPAYPTTRRPTSLRGWLRVLFTHSHPQPPTGKPLDRRPDESTDGTTHSVRLDSADRDRRDTAPRLTTALILWLGISGGIVPCPAATWMMLAAIAQGRPAAGLFAVGVFSLGLALTLMAIGFAALSSRRVAMQLMGEEGSQKWLLGVLPTLGGALLAAFGLVIAAHYAYLILTGSPLISWLG